jgi:hypothetical protein
MDRVERANGFAREAVFGAPRDLFRDLEDRPGGSRLSQGGPDPGGLHRRDAALALGAATRRVSITARRDAMTFSAAASADRIVSAPSSAKSQRSTALVSA